MHLGCHAVLFRDRIKTETENIIKNLSETGFEASEIGARFFSIDDKEMLLDMLGKHKYQLSGMHTGGPLENWINPEKREGQKKNVLAVAKFVQDMPKPVLCIRPWLGVSGWI